MRPPPVEASEHVDFASVHRPTACELVGWAGADLSGAVRPLLRAGRPDGRTRPSSTLRRHEAKPRTGFPPRRRGLRGRRPALPDGRRALQPGGRIGRCGGGRGLLRPQRLRARAADRRLGRRPALAQPRRLPDPPMDADDPVLRGRAPRRRGHDRNLFTADTLRYLVYVENLFRSANSVDFYPVAWSLAVEEWFYVLFAPLLLLAGRALGRNDRRVDVAFAVAFILRSSRSGPVRRRRRLGSRRSARDGLPHRFDRVGIPPLPRARAAVAAEPEPPQAVVSSSRSHPPSPSHPSWNFCYRDPALEGVRTRSRSFPTRRRSSA